MKTLSLGLMPAGATPESHLAAGPWCFCGQEAAFPGWSESFAFAPEPLADASGVPRAARAAQYLCVKLIPEAASLLCPEPAILPPEYWQVLLAPWLIDLASQLVERALRSQALIAMWGNEELSVPVLPQDCEFEFASEQDFTLRGDLGVAYNHWLFSRLLEISWPEKWRRVELEAVQPESPQASGWRDRGKKLLRRFALALPFPVMKGMKPLQALELSAALGHPCHIPDGSLDMRTVFNYPEELAEITLPDDLAPILEKSLPASIKRLTHKAVTRSVGKPRLRVASIVAQEDSAYRQRLARWKAMGNRIAHCQHGGNYGMVRIPCSAEISEYSQDAFFTWGWIRQGNARGNFLPLPSIQLSGERDSWQGGENLIFTGAEMAAYPYRLDSRPTPLQFVRYRQAKADFFRELGPTLRAKTLYRPYFALPGVLEDASWLLPHFPELRLCEGPLLPQIQRCRLLVLDHHGTTLLEAMAAGIPVICYWNRDYWPICVEGENLLAALEAAGIWQKDAVTAARHVKEIWQDVRVWWNSEKVSKARKIFSSQQALASADALPLWQATLRKL